MSVQQNHLTALHSASREGHAEVVGVLLAAMATVNTQVKVSSTLYALYRLESLLFGQPAMRVTKEWWNC